MDHYCIPLLEYEPKPTTEQLIEIVSSLKPVYPNVNTKQLLSKVMKESSFIVCFMFKGSRMVSKAERIHEPTDFPSLFGDFQGLDN